MVYGFTSFMIFVHQSFLMVRIKHQHIHPLCHPTCWYPLLLLILLHCHMSLLVDVFLEPVQVAIIVPLLSSHGHVIWIISLLLERDGHRYDQVYTSPDQ